MSPTAVALALTADSYAGLEERFERVRTDDCLPSDTNPRKTFHIDDLVASVAEKGVIDAVVLRERPKAQRGARFEIVDGERRWRAAGQAHIETLPAIIRNYTDSQVVEVQLVTSLQRADLSPLERAETYGKLIGSARSKDRAGVVAARLQLPVAAVWDVLLLTDLVPDAKTILTIGKITVDHAILIAKLTPEQQQELIDPDNVVGHWDGGGLWETDESFDFDDPANKGKKAGKYDEVKPVSVNELRGYIRDHVRFNPTHAAQTQPFAFEETARTIETVLAQPGRGKKMVWITHDSRIDDAAKDPAERTFGCDSWERADGKLKSKTCEYSVLGVVAAGRGQGETLQVCVNREKCKVHFKASVLAKEKSAKLRAGGNTKKAAKVDEKAEQKAAAKRAAEEAAQASWTKLQPLLEREAFAQLAKTKTLTAAVAKEIRDSEAFNYEGGNAVDTVLGKTWFKTPAAALAVAALASAYGLDSFDEFVTYAKKLGVDVKKLAAIRDQHAPKVETPAAAKKKSR